MAARTVAASPLKALDPNVLANADTPVDAKNILKTRLRPKPPTVLSPLAKDYEPMNDHDDDSNDEDFVYDAQKEGCLLYTSPSPRDATLSRMPSSA